MTCAPDKLDAYIDGELNPADLAGFEAHLRSCSACSTEALARWQLKRSVRAAAQQFQPSPEFRTRIAGQIATGRVRGQRPIGYSGLFAAIAAVLLAVISVPPIVRHSARQHVVAELLDLHVATLASSNPVDVVSSDRHTVKPWFQGKLPFTFNLPELSSSQYKLLGGKLIYFDNHPGAQLLFSLRQHRISVFILQNSVAALAGGQMEKGFSVESSNIGGLRYVIISDASPTDVQPLADLLRGAQPQ